MTDFFDDIPGDGEQPDESTEEFLLGGIDEEIRPEPSPNPPSESPAPGDGSSGSLSARIPAEPPPGAGDDAGSGEGSPEEPPASEPPVADEPPAADEPSSADPAVPQPGQPGEYVEQGTEEMFALDAARILDGEEVPELDPILRAALLEGSEAEVSSANTGEEPLTGDNWHDAPETAEGELPAGPDEPETGTQEWEAPSEADLTAEHTMELAALAKSEVHEAIATARKTGEPWSPARPPVGGDFQEPPKRQRY